MASVIDDRAFARIVARSQRRDNDLERDFLQQVEDNCVLTSTQVVLAAVLRGSVLPPVLGHCSLLSSRTELCKRPSPCSPALFSCGPFATVLRKPQSNKHKGTDGLMTLPGDDTDWQIRNRGKLVEVADSDRLASTLWLKTRHLSNNTSLSRHKLLVRQASFRQQARRTSKRSTSLQLSISLRVG